MRSAVLREGQVLVVDDVPEPTPARGQALARVLACGICGSDLHFAAHASELLELSETMVDAPVLVGDAFDLARDVFMGHELVAEILELAPGTEGPAPGTVVVSIPGLLMDGRLESLGYTNNVPAGYSERMLLSPELMVPVPAGLDPDVAALTEPMAVAVRAVNRSGIEPGDTALVLGCGPIGLCLVAVLRWRGIEPIIAADLSLVRRLLADATGAHTVVDPEVESAVEKARRAARRAPLVIFEAVGVPGMLNAVLREAPRHTRIMVAGVCMQRDELVPYFAAGKELTLLFSFGYDLDEFRVALHGLADGDLDGERLITTRIPLDGVPEAFTALARPDEHAKIIVHPAR